MNTKLIIFIVLLSLSLLIFRCSNNSNNPVSPDKLGISISIDPALDSKFNADYLTKGIFSLTSRCFVLWESILLGPNGNLSICPMLTHYPIANAKEVSLADYWYNNKELNKVRNILLKEKYIPICSYCCLHTQMMF